VSPPDAGAVVGVGVDLVDVQRFRRVLARRPGLAERVFTAAERAEASRRLDPAEPLAARFAAKEAAMKALGSGLGAFALRDVEVVSGPGPGARRGAPTLRLSAGAARTARASGVARWHVSLSHTAEMAVAMVVAEGPASSVAGPVAR
jgi:holo-[acyl-carrier protein] synthase